MWIVSNDLGGILPEMSNLSLERNSLFRILNSVKIDRIFISEREEYVHVFDSGFSSLFVPKY